MITISHVVALSNNNVIGVDNNLPWNLKTDLAHFKDYTTNKIIVMGRKTFESIGRPLPNRKNLIVSNTLNEINGASIYKNTEEAIKSAEDICINDEIYNEIGSGVDVLIDDGSHLCYSQITTVNIACGGFVNSGGIVIIEDTHTSYIKGFSGFNSKAFLKLVQEIIGCMHARSPRLLREKKNALANLSPDNIFKNNVDSIRIFESIFAFKIVKDLQVSKEIPSFAKPSKPIEDRRRDSKRW